MTTDVVLRINGLTVRYKGVTALDSISLAVRAGEIHAVLGDNGAGKTTVLKALVGLLKSAECEGEILLDGEPIVIRSPQDALGHGVGFVARRPGIFPGLTVADNIVVGAWQQEHTFIINQQRVHEQAQRALDLVGLRLDPNAKAGGLTPIQQRLMMIGRALVRPPKVVVLDEPASYLTTAAELGQLFTVVRGLAARGIATLYMSRRPTEVLQIADRITILRDGAIAGEQERATFDETALVRDMMSQRIGDAGYVDYDDLNEAKTGWLDGLRSIFTGNRG